MPVYPVSSYLQQYLQQQQPYQYYYPAPSHPLADTVNSRLPPQSPSVSIPKALPAVEHIPLLSGRSDFGVWNNSIRSLILYLGHLGHISNPPAPGVISLSDRLPTYPPPLLQPPTNDELTASHVWWKHDNVVSHILTTCLTSTVLSILPFDDDNDGLNPRTARTIYELLRKLYSVHDHISSSALYTELCNLQCGNRVQEYVTRWRRGITQLRAAKFIISYRIVIEQFLDQLPTSVPYQILQFRVMETIDTIPVDDVSAFIKLTDDVLRIDNTYRRRSLERSTSACSSPHLPPNIASNKPDIIDEPEIPPSSVAALSVIKPPVIISTKARRKLDPTSKSSLKQKPTLSSTAITPAKPSAQSARSSLICTNTNCGDIGHTIESCFKIGGGLEGKRDQYVASRNRAQAHLVHLTEILEGNLVDESQLPSISSDTSEPDIIQPEVPPVVSPSSPPFTGLTHSVLTSPNLISHMLSQSTQGPRATLAVSWTFTKGVQVQKHDDEDATNSFFGCLDDDHRSRRVPDSPSTYSFAPADDNASPFDVVLPPVHGKGKGKDKYNPTTTSSFSNNAENSENGDESYHYLDNIESTPILFSNVLVPDVRTQNKIRLILSKILYTSVPSKLIPCPKSFLFLPYSIQESTSCSLFYYNPQCSGLRTLFGGIQRHLFKINNVRIKAEENDELVPFLSCLNSDTQTSSALRQFSHPTRQQHLEYVLPRFPLVFDEMTKLWCLEYTRDVSPRLPVDEVAGTNTGTVGDISMNGCIVVVSGTNESAVVISGIDGSAAVDVKAYGVNGGVNIAGESGFLILCSPDTLADFLSALDSFFLSLDDIVTIFNEDLSDSPRQSPAPAIHPIISRPLRTQIQTIAGHDYDDALRLKGFRTLEHAKTRATRARDANVELCIGTGTNGGASCMVEDASMTGGASESCVDVDVIGESVLCGRALSIGRGYRDVGDGSGYLVGRFSLFSGVF